MLFRLWNMVYSRLVDTPPLRTLAIMDNKNHENFPVSFMFLKLGNILSFHGVVLIKGKYNDPKRMCRAIVQIIKPLSADVLVHVVDVVHYSANVITVSLT